MKRINNLYNKMVNYDEIYKVFNHIKSNTKNKREVLKFGYNINQNILDILSLIYYRRYSFGKYHIFLIKEPKYRLIMSENIKDKLVNHLFTKKRLSCLEDSLIDSNVATRCNKGSKEAYRLFIKYINTLMYKNKDIYVLKIDISKYFYNINHSKLLDMVSEKIKDKEVINFLKNILDSTNYQYINEDINRVVSEEKEYVMGKNISKLDKIKLCTELDSIPLYKKGYGLPIGNYSSQILAVFYLNKVDHYIKEKLMCKYYIRYMDDLIILDNDKDRLLSIFKSISDKLIEYDLCVNKKSRIYNLKYGINFLGYSFKVIDKLLIKYRSDTFKRASKRIKCLLKYDISMYYKSIASYNGYFSMCNTCGKFINNK